MRELAETLYIVVNVQGLYTHSPAYVFGEHKEIKIFVARGEKLLPPRSVTSRGDRCQRAKLCSDGLWFFPIPVASLQPNTLLGFPGAASRCRLRSHNLVFPSLSCKTYVQRWAVWLDSRTFSCKRQAAG